MRVNKCPKKSGLLKWVSIVLMVAALAWTAASTPLSYDYYKWENTCIDCGWTQLLDGIEIPLEQVEDYIEIPVGDTLVLTTQLPTLYEDKALFFYTKDVEVQVYIEDTLVYAFEMEEGFSFLKTPGQGWNFVELPSQYSQQTLRLELTSQFSNRFQTTVSGLYFINQQNTSGVVWMEKGFLVVMAIATVTMAVTAYINALVWKRKQIKQYYVALANFYLCASLWILPMSGLMNYFFHRPVLSYLCSMFFAIFVPVSIYELLRAICREKSKRLTALGVLFWGNFIIQFALQFILGISLLDLLFVTEMVYLLGCFLGGWMIFDHYRACRGTPDLNIPFMTILIMIGGGLIEIPVLLLLPERTDLIGVASLVGLVLYLVINQIYLSHQESTMDIASVTLEQNYNKLQNTGLMEQIKAHFFFNTLNTISALCKTEPQEADRAISLFAQYMRTHMYLINQHENIPFAQELKLLESTLAIEAVRFPGRFTYTVDTPYLDFVVPPLSVQPIVENALLHGLRGKSSGGEVAVRTCRKAGCTVVTIEDNGIGFDVKEVHAGPSLGIKNLRKRVELMTNGTVVIESQPGMGTIVTMTFADETT